MKIKQLRYYGTDDSHNNVTESILNSGAFSDIDGQVIKLSIQSVPGISFYLGDVGTDNEIKIGFNGLFELDLSDQTTIPELIFPNDSLSKIDNVKSAYLLIDIAYEE